MNVTKFFTIAAPQPMNTYVFLFFVFFLNYISGFPGVCWGQLKYQITLVILYQYQDSEHKYRDIFKATAIEYFCKKFH